MGMYMSKKASNHYHINVDDDASAPNHSIGFSLRYFRWAAVHIIYIYIIH